MIIFSGGGRVAQGWLKSSPLRFLLPALTWTGAAAIGGLFVYGCGSSPTSNTIRCDSQGSMCPTITVTVTGLASGQTIIVDDTSSNIADGPDQLTFTGPNPPQQPFAVSLASGSPYAISIDSKSTATETCLIPSNGTSPMGGITQNITVAISCGFTVGGTLTGVPSGLPSGQPVLDDNGTPDTYTVTGNSFVLATPIAPDTAYAVTMPTPPTGYNCPITGGGNGTGGGTIGSANVTNVVITCTSSPTPPPPTYTITAVVSGLTSGNTVTLANTDNHDTLTETTNGSFAFATALANTTAYDVTAVTTPTGVQTCTPGSNAKGSINGANVTVNITCATNAPNTYQIGGTISGLTAAGLVLQDNGGDNDTIGKGATNFNFATKLATGAMYSVSVSTQPATLHCTVGNATGTVGTSDVTNITVTCNSTGGSITGPVLATVINVQPGSTVTYNSTISFYDISAPLTPTQIGTSISTTNVTSIAIDASNNVYYLANTGSVVSPAGFYVCPAPTTSPPSYSCSQKGSASVNNGSWLAVDGIGNAYVATTQGSPPFGVVRFPVSGPTSSNQTQVYTSQYGTSEYFGLAVSSDGTQIFVAESVDTADMSITLHTCSISTPCLNGGTDITTAVTGAASSTTYVSGALATGPHGNLYVGAFNAFGNGSTPPSLPVVLVCTTSGTVTCETGSQSFNAVDGTINPYQQSAGVAVDASGNAYVAAVLNGYGATPTPAPTFMAFQPPTTAGAALTPFACTTLVNSEPACPINLLPAPAVLDASYIAPPYSMAVTHP